MAPYVRERIDAFENEQMVKVRENDNKALDLFKQAMDGAEKKGKKASVAYDVMSDTGSSFSAVKSLLTKYSVDTAQKMFKAWQELEITMTVKFIDGNVKAQNPDGSFKLSKYGIGDRPSRPGYPTRYAKELIKQSGDKFLAR